MTGQGRGDSEGESEAREGDDQGECGQEGDGEG